MAQGSANGKQRPTEPVKPTPRGGPPIHREPEPTPAPPPKKSGDSGQWTREALLKRSGTPGEIAVTLTLRIPVKPPGGYLTDRIDIGRLTTRQAAAYNHLWCGLVEQRAVLADGRMVSNQFQVDAIRWLLEQLAEAMAAQGVR